MALGDGIVFANGVGLIAIELALDPENPGGVIHNLLAQERTALVSGGRESTIGITGGGFMDFRQLNQRRDGEVERHEGQLWRELCEEFPDLPDVMGPSDLETFIYPIRGGQFSVNKRDSDQYGNNIHCCSYYGWWVRPAIADVLLGLKGSSETKRLVRRRLLAGKREEPMLEHVENALPDLYHKHEALAVYQMLRFRQESWKYSEVLASL